MRYTDRGVVKCSGLSTLPIVAGTTWMSTKSYAEDECFECNSAAEMDLFLAEQTMCRDYGLTAETENCTRKFWNRGLYVRMSGAAQHGQPSLLPSSARWFLIYRRYGESYGACLVTFLLIYYFTFAAAIWFVSLTYCWYRSFRIFHSNEAKVRATGFLKSYSLRFHLAAWCTPLILCLIAIATSGVSSSQCD